MNAASVSGRVLNCGIQYWLIHLRLAPAHLVKVVM